MKPTASIISTVSLLVATFSLYENVQLKQQIGLLELNQNKNPVSECQNNQSMTDSAEHVNLKPKFVSVDFQDLFQAYRQNLDQTKNLDQTVGKANIALNNKRETLTKLLESLAQKQNSLKQEEITPEQIEAISTEASKDLRTAQALKQEIEEQAQLIQTKVNEESAYIDQQSLANLKRAIKRKAEEKGYQYVINAQAIDLTQTPFFLYQYEQENLTDSLMEDLGLRTNHLSQTSNVASTSTPHETSQTEAQSETVVPTSDSSLNSHTESIKDKVTE